MSKIWQPLELDSSVDENGGVKITGVSIVEKSNDPYAGYWIYVPDIFPVSQEVFDEFIKDE